MSVNLSPIGNGWQFLDANGNPLNAGLLYTYAAGTTTPQTTYTTNAGNVANANPIVLNTDGRLANEIWFTAGVSYKLTLKDSLSNSIASWDNLTGINDIASSTVVSEWISGGFTGLTFLGTTQFSVSGNQTSILTVNRRLKTVNTSGTFYGYITVSTFGSGVTTVTMVLDSGVLDSGLSAIFYGIINPVNSSLFPATITQTLNFTHSLNEGKGVNVASVAGSTDIWSAEDGNTIHITGTNSITGFATAPQAGSVRRVVADGAFTLVNGANLVCPGGVDKVCAVDDVFYVYADTTTKMYVMNYSPSAGIKKSLKDHGIQSTNYTINIDDADMHVIAFTASVTLIIASRKTSDKALIVVKNGNNTITLSGIDNNSPTLTVAASTQDFLAIAKSFGKITCMSTQLNQATA